MLLSDKDIKKEVEEGRIRIDDFDEGGAIEFNNRVKIFLKDS